MIHVAVFSGLRVSELVGPYGTTYHDDALTVDETLPRGYSSIMASLHEIFYYIV